MCKQLVRLQDNEQKYIYVYIKYNTEDWNPLKYNNMKKIYRHV